VFIRFRTKQRPILVVNAVQVEMQRRHFYTAHHATKVANATAAYRTKHGIIDINMG